MLIDVEIDEAKSLGSRNALRVKKYSVLAMGLVSATQLYFSMGAWAGSSAAGLVVAPWIVIAFALLGIVYLTASLVADALTLNGLKLWLYRSRWGKSENCYWENSKQGNADELIALHEVLLRPSIIAKTQEDGVWLKLIFPPSIAGQTISLYPMMVTEGNWFRSDRETGYRAGMYSGYMSEGRWTELNELGEWDSLGTRNHPNTAWPAYQATDWRIWLVHIPRSRGMDRFDICINYPPAVLQRPDNLGYRFSINLARIQEGRLHQNPYVRDGQAEPDKNDPFPLDKIPGHSKSTFNLEVI